MYRERQAKWINRLIKSVTDFFLLLLIKVIALTNSIKIYDKQMFTSISNVYLQMY